MKKAFKSYLALIVVFCLTMPMIGPTYAAPTDVQAHWAAKELNSWVDQKLLQGYADGSLRPDAVITRAEFISFINRVLHLTDRSNKIFPDVKMSSWYSDSILKAYHAGIIEGDNNGNMNPTAPISRQEAATVLSRAFKLKGNISAANTFVDYSEIADWAKASVGAMKTNGYIVGRDGNRFAPEEKITRAETVKMINNVMGQLISLAGTYTGDKPGNLVVNTKDIILSNMTVDGNLYLTQGIGEGDVIIQNVKVTGTTYIEGGGTKGIKIENSSLDIVSINKKDGKVGVVFGKGSRVASIIISSGASLENNSETNISNVRVDNPIAASQTVTLRGNISDFTMEGSASVTLASGIIEEFLTAASSEGSSVTIEEGARITSLTLNSGVTIGGIGKIENAIINVQGSRIAQKPTRITFKDGIYAWIAGNKVSAGTVTGTVGGGITPPKEETPLLTFPVMSDTHIGIEDVIVDSEAKFKQALKVYNEIANYDAIVINGDIVDSGTETQYDTAMKILNENKVSGAKSILTPGNHEYYARKEPGSDRFKAAERFYNKTGMNAEGYYVEAVDKNTENSGVYYDTWVKGYHFIVMYHDRNKMSSEKYKWLEQKISQNEQGKSADPDKPVFIFSHVPFTGTTYGSEDNGWDDTEQFQKFKDVITKYKNAMLFTAHTHYTLEHPNTINTSAGFLCFNDSSVAFDQQHGYSNDSDIFLDKNKSQGLLVKVYDAKLVVERRELGNNGALIGDPYIIDLNNPVESAKKYTTDVRNPEFTNGTKLSVSSVSVVSASFTWPKAIDDTKIDFYEITVNDKLIGAPVVISPFIEAESHTFIANGLTPNTDYTVSIKAHDAYGKISTPITATFRTHNAPDGYDALKADVLDMDFNNVNGKVVMDRTLNKNDAVLENNAQIANDAKFAKNALLLDGMGERGKPSSVARVKYNSSMFKQDAITIETAVYISPDSDLSKEEYHILGNYENGGFYLYYSAEDKKFVFDVQTSDDPAESSEITDVKGKVFYITAVYDGNAASGYLNGSIKLYINGVLVGSNITTGPLLINETNDLIIGGDSECHGDVINLFEGAIDHVKIFSRALSDAEISAHYDEFNDSLNVSP